DFQLVIAYYIQGIKSTGNKIYRGISQRRGVRITLGVKYTDQSTTRISILVRQHIGICKFFAPIAVVQLVVVQPDIKSFRTWYGIQRGSSGNLTRSGIVLQTAAKRDHHA